MGDFIDFVSIEDCSSFSSISSIKMSDDLFLVWINFSIMLQIFSFNSDSLSFIVDFLIIYVVGLSAVFWFSILF